MLSYVAPVTFPGVRPTRSAGPERNRTSKDRKGTEQNRREQNGMEWNRKEQNGTERKEAERRVETSCIFSRKPEAKGHKITTGEESSVTARSPNTHARVTSRRKNNQLRTRTKQ